MNRNKFYAAVLILVFGIGGFWESLHYERGTLAHMGPGYYPLMLSIALIVLGILVAVVPEAEQPEAAAAIPLKKYLRPWAAVIGGSVVFIVLGIWGGLIPAVFATLFVAGLGDRANSLRDCLLLGLAAVVFTVIVFHYGMHI